MYAKLMNGKLDTAPYYIKKDGKDIFGYNLESNSAMLIEDGYKIVEDLQQPLNMKQPRKVWVEKADKIIATWVDDYVEPTIAAQNETIRLKRNEAYENTTDQLTLRKLRKQALGIWTEKDETDYIETIKNISEKINIDFPYINIEE